LTFLDRFSEDTQISNFMKTDFSWQIFKRYWNIKLRENPSYGSRVVLRWRTDL